MSLHNEKNCERQSRLITIALTSVALLAAAPSPARAADWLETLNQTLNETLVVQPSDAIISETGAMPPQGQSVPQSTQSQGGEVFSAPPSATGGSQPGGGVISETGQSDIATEIENAAQTGAGSVIDNGIGRVSGAVGRIFGNRGGVVGEFLNPFERLMQKYIGAAQSYLHNAVSKFLGSIFGNADTVGSGTGDATDTDGTTSDDVASAVGANVPAGTMGLPDFDKVKTEIENKSKSGSSGTPADAAQKVDRFNLNPIALSRSLSAEQDRTLGRTISASVLSDDGQKAMTEERAAAAQTLKQLQAKAQEAQKLDVTQDVMKNLAQMAAGQASLESGTYAQTMLIRQQMAVNGVVETNISEAIDEINRGRRVEAMAGASRLLQSASSLYLPGS